MANLKPSNAYIFLLCLLLAGEALLSEARHLTEEKHENEECGTECSTKGISSSDRSIPRGIHSQEVDERHKPMVPTDDTRPTAPGHSPGIGHTVEIERRQPVVTTDGNRPTSHGHSPGIGHTVETKVVGKMP